MQSVPPPLPKRHDSWWDRNWKWFVPVLVVGCIGAAVAFVLGVTALLKNSEPYQIALARAREHPAVIAALGTPIEDGTFVQGTRQTNLAGRRIRGTAVMTISLSGPKAKAVLILNANQSDGAWRLDSAVVQVLGTRETIDLSDPPARK